VVGQYSIAEFLSSVIDNFPVEFTQYLNLSPVVSQLTAPCAQVPAPGNSPDLTEVANDTPDLIVLVGAGCASRHDILTSGPSDESILIDPGDDVLVAPPLNNVTESICVGDLVDC
jgi:hypothetical protein